MELLSSSDLVSKSLMTGQESAVLNPIHTHFLQWRQDVPERSSTALGHRMCPVTFPLCRLQGSHEFDQVLFLLRGQVKLLNHIEEFHRVLESQ